MASKQKVTGNLAVSEQQRVIVIEATEKPQDLKLRVAAYTRVSSDYGNTVWRHSTIKYILQNDCDIIGLNQQALVPQAVALI